jgi:FtsP/CotA-like multicopper oxidase with cupredoxin domain
VDTRISRRAFLGLGLTGLAGAMALGTQAGRIPALTGGRARAAGMGVELRIDEADVEMIDLSRVFMWTFGDDDGPRLPGPTLTAIEGDTIELSVRNRLDEPHAFAIAGTPISTGPIPDGERAELTFTAPAAGTYIYLDPLAAPVNRLMGLHGVLVVLPASGPTPYSAPPRAVRALFDDLGRAPHFPGEPWRADRSRIWHLHTVDPRWHEMARRGEAIDPARMASGYLPRYFLLNGQSGYFASHDPATCPSGRIGQPHLIRIVNTGMVSNSLHIHGNHVYVVAEGGAPQESVPYVDSWSVPPLGRADWLLPFLRPPDIPGPESSPLRTVLREELAHRDRYGLRQSPIEYPMHCHVEPSQTAAGGNYPGGLVTHWEITGDLDGVDFPP